MEKKERLSLSLLCKTIKAVKKELKRLPKTTRKTSDETTILEGNYWIINKSYYPTPEQQEEEIKKMALENIKRQNVLLELLDILNNKKKYYSLCS